MAKSKICILHDFFLYRGGAERFDVMAAKACGADLAAAYFEAGSFDLASMGFEGRSIHFSRRLFPESGNFSGKTEAFFDRTLPDKVKRILRYAFFKRDLVKKTGFLGDYETVVFSGDTLDAVINCDSESKKICYFHSIPRYLFDQKDLYLSKVPFLLRPFFITARHFTKRRFFASLSKIDEIYVNGENLRSYCEAYLGRSSKILYPPVDTAEFSPCDPAEKSEYYVSFSKLATFKRVDAAVRAFAKMPDKKLLVIYGENDPQKNEILLLAKGLPNIECRILADNRELPKIVARAIATLFISKNEDFGMVAIESMAAGTPVIGSNSGGIKETVIAGKTGIFVNEDFTVDDLVEAVVKMTPELALSMRDECVKRSDTFSYGRFETEIRNAFSARPK